MTSPATRRLYTIAEYLASEETARDRHEYHNGEVLAMSGGTFRHSQIGSNLFGQLFMALRGNPCRAVGPDARVRIMRQMHYVYPDITVICGEPKFDPDDQKQTTIVNPKLIVEILSDSTASYDRGEKFALYRDIVSLDEYVICDQRQPRVETYLRQADGSWNFTDFVGLDAVAVFRSLGVSVPLLQIYDGVTFDPPGTPNISQGE